MTRWTKRAAPMAILIGLGLAAAVPASAQTGPADRNAAAAVGDDAVARQAAGTPVAGFVWAHNPTAASYTPLASWSYNSSGGTNTITRVGVGNYDVFFGGIGAASGGIAHVTPYGETPGRCAVNGWALQGVDERVNIRCFDLAGAPADRQFEASYTLAIAGAFAGDVAYAWADQASNPTYTPNLAYQFDSAGGKIKITRPAAGTYTVRIANLGEDSGTVKLSAYGVSSNVCRVLRWFSNGTALVVKVQCHDVAGNLADTQFSIMYTDQQNLAAENGMRDGYVLADRPKAAQYNPNPSYSFNVVAGTNVVDRFSRGFYRVTLPGLEGPDGGSAQVTAYGSGTTLCQVRSWATVASPDIGVNVLCFNRVTGNRADGMFTMQFATPV